MTIDRNFSLLKLLIGCLILTMTFGCDRPDFGIKGNDKYQSYLELDAVQFLVKEVFVDLPKYAFQIEKSVDLEVLRGIKLDNILLASKACKWTPQFGNFDYPLNLPSFECYDLPTSEVDYIRSVDVSSFLQHSKSYLLVVSRPLVYEWGGFIEVVFYSEAFGIDNPTFFIIKKHDNMYLHSVGAISGLPAR